jgi:hypothetical protein
VRKFHRPPSGAEVEKASLYRYMERAATTRFLAGDRELEHQPSPAQHKLFVNGLRLCFLQSPKPSTFTKDDLFDPIKGGRLRPELFIKAYSHIKKDSSPGFPFHDEYPANEDVPMDLLYCLVETLLYQLMSLSFLELETMDFMEDCCVFYPAHLFTKGEPTSQSKFSRNIYGVSLVMQIVGRILFGDYLQAIGANWGDTNHKVGMDMYTEAGVSTLTGCFEKVFKMADLTATEVVSDDIQGWEYMGRKWMHRAWHQVYLERAAATPFHRALQLKYALLEERCFVMFSDGVIAELSNYITCSGHLTTHIKNSQERSALAMMDCPAVLMAASSYWKLNGVVPVTNCTNGDDCVAPLPSVRPLSSELLGFVHTDVLKQRIERVTFSSQVFLDGKVRIPDGIAKTYYSSVYDSSDESRLGKVQHLAELPSLGNYLTLVLLSDCVPSWKNASNDDRVRLIRDFLDSCKRVRYLPKPLPSGQD